MDDRSSEAESDCHYWVLVTRTEGGVARTMGIAALCLGLLETFGIKKESILLIAKQSLLTNGRKKNDSCVNGETESMMGNTRLNVCFIVSALVSTQWH